MIGLRNAFDFGLSWFCFFVATFSGTLGISGLQYDVVRVFAAEGGDAMLPCSLGEDIVSKLFDWKTNGQDVFFYDAGIHYNNRRAGQSQQFKNRVFHFQDELKNGNASIIIRNTKMNDGGLYTCDFPRHGRIFHIQLVVNPTFKDRSGEISGATPKPHIKIVNATESGALLRCDVRGASPEVKLEDGDKNVLPALLSSGGDGYDFTLLATVTKAGIYRCVVTQEDINHTTAADTYVPFCEDSSSKVITGWLVGGLIGLVLGASLLAAGLAWLITTKRFTFRRNKGPLEQDGYAGDRLVSPPA